MDLIVAVSANWAIGKDNSLLFSLSEDMKYFKKMTMEKTVILGRKTLDSFPGGKPLKGRRNIVLTRDSSFYREGVSVCHSTEEVLSLIADTPKDDAMVIGGAEIYRHFLPMCSKAYVTKIDTCVPDADTFFPDLDADPAWKLISATESMEENGHRFRFCTYRKD